MVGVVSQKRVQERPRSPGFAFPLAPLRLFRDDLAKDFDSPCFRSDFLIAACSMLIGIFSLCTMIAAGYLNYTRVPWLDAWDLWIVRASGMSFWSSLFALFNGHRIPTQRLLYLADEKLFHAEAWSLLLCTFLSQFATCLIIYRLARSKTSTLASRATILGLIFAFLFSASQWINFTDTFQVCFLFVYTTSIGALAALARSARNSWSEHPWSSMLWLTGSLLMALLSAGSMANGVVVWPLLVLLGLFLRLPRGVTVVLFALTLVVFMSYLYHYSPDPEHSVVWTDLMSKTTDLMTFALAYLGSAYVEPLMYLTKSVGLNWEAYQVAIAAVIGAMGIGWFLQIILTTLGEKLPVSGSRITLLHITAFLSGSAALTSLGRVQFTMLTAVTSRYTTPSVLFWACLFILTIAQPVSEQNATGQYRIRIAALCVAFFLGGLIQLPKVAYAIACEQYIREIEYTIINGAFDASVWQRESYSAGRMISAVSYLRQNHLAMFSPDWTRWTGDPVTEHFRLTSNSGNLLGACEYSHSLAYTFHPSTVSEGWAYDLHLKRAPKMIVFTDEANRILGFSSCQRERKNVTGQHPEFRGAFVGWIAYLPGGVAKDATAFAVLEDGKSLCPLAKMHLPGACITAPASKAGSMIAGVTARTLQGWSSSLPESVENPPYTTPVISSYRLQSGTGELRLGPVQVAEGTGIGLPVATGPGAKGIRLSVVDRNTDEVLSVTEVPPGAPAWNLWRFDNPSGNRALTVEYAIEDSGTGRDDWVAVGMPRTVIP